MYFRIHIVTFLPCRKNLMDADPVLDLETGVVDSVRGVYGALGVDKEHVDLGDRRVVPVAVGYRFVGKARPTVV